MLPQVLLIFNFFSYHFHSSFFSFTSFLYFFLFFIAVIHVACNIISGTIIAGISIFFIFFSFFSVCGARIRGVFLSGIFFFTCSCFGLENIPRVDTHVRPIVRRAYRETCVTIDDDRKAAAAVQCGEGTIIIFCTSFGDATGRRQWRRGTGFFFPSANGRKQKKDRKKKRKDPSGWTAISSWFDIKGFGVVSFEGQDFSLGSELHGSFFFSYTFFLCSHSSQGET